MKANLIGKKSVQTVSLSQAPNGTLYELAEPTVALSWEKGDVILVGQDEAWSLTQGTYVPGRKNYTGVLLRRLEPSEKVEVSN